LVPLPLLAAGVARVVGTCSPPARVLRAHTPTAHCALGAAGSLSVRLERSPSLPPHRLASPLSPVLSSHTPTPTTTTFSTNSNNSVSFSSPTAFTQAQPASLLFSLRPLFGRVQLSPPIGGGHASSLRHRHRWAFTPGEKSREIFLRRHPKQWEAFFLFFLSWRLLAGNSRRSRTTALFAREFWAGNLAASPSIPRGMSPHGARWLWVVVGEVAL